MSSWLSSHAERKCNMSVIAPSTPSQYFHCLRRQIHRPFCKPAAIFTSKWLLRHKHCVSNLEEMGYNTFFRRIICEGTRCIRFQDKIVCHVMGIILGLPGDNMRERTARKLPGLKRSTEVKKVILCSGKIFYHLYHRRSALKLEDITFIRVEQVAPFPFELLYRAIQRYPNAGWFRHNHEYYCDVA